MADSTPQPPTPGKEKKDTVRITLPPRPVQGAAAPPPPAAASSSTSSAPLTPAGGISIRSTATVPAMPIVGKKETSRLKKTTGKVPGATKPAMPVVPPPTLKAQPVPSKPASTITAAPVAQSSSTIVAAPATQTSATTAAAAKPTMKLQSSEIANIQSLSSKEAPAAEAVAAPSGPGVVDLVLSLLMLAVTGAAAYLVWNLCQTTL